MDSLQGELSSDNLRETVQKRLICLGYIPGRLEQIRIMTVRALLDKDLSTSSSEEQNRSASPSVTNQASTSCMTDHGTSCHSSVVLVGQLIAAIEERSSSEYHVLPSELSFSDTTGRMPCFVTNISLTLMNRSIIILQWNFIKTSPGSGYLEICRVAALNNNARIDRQPLSAFTAKDASFLQSNRGVVGSRLINVIGEVSAVSHPMRLKETIVCLVCLRDSDTSQRVIILNRDLKKLYWHLLLRLQKQYIFTNLRPTTLYPNSEKKTDVLLITNESQCYLASDVTDCTEIISVLDYLKSQGFDEELYSAWKRDTAGESMIHPMNFSIFNFKGTITKDSLSDIGFFELDGNIRLHLRNVADVTNFRHLRVGTKVALFNVHILKSSQVSGRNIYCCYFGCVRIEKFSDELPLPSSVRLSTASDPDVENVMPAVMHILGDRSLAFVDFDIILEAAKSFQRQFCPKLVQCFDEQLFYNVVCYRTTKSSPPVERKSRKAIMEFVSNDHDVGCGISSKAMKSSGFRLASVADVSNIFTTFANKAKNGFRAEGNDSGYSCQVISSEDLTPKWIITAALRASQSSARLQLIDQTGSIDCIVASAHNNMKSFNDLHQCVDDNCREGQELHFPASPTCPYPQTWYIGCLFRISNFRVVREQFSEQAGFSNSSATSVIYSYVEFSLTGTLCLRKVDVLHPSFKWTSLIGNPVLKIGKRRKLLSAIDSSKCAQAKNVSCERCGQGICSLNCPTRKGSGNQECSAAYSLAEPSTADIVSESSDPAAKNCTCFVSHKFVLCHKESILARCNLPSRVVLSFSLDAFLFGKAYEFNCGCKQSSVSNELPAASPFGRYVSLLFQGKAICWYPMLYAGCVYCLTVYKTADQKIFSGNLISPGLRKFGVKQAMILDRNVHLDRITPLGSADRSSHCRTVAECGPSERLEVTGVELATVKRVLQELQKKSFRMSDFTSRKNIGDGNMLVSFKGLVVSRGFREQQCSATGRPFVRNASTEAALHKLALLSQCPRLQWMVASSENAIKNHDPLEKSVSLKSDRSEKPKPGVGSFRNLNIWLIMRNLTSSDEYSVYINPSRIQYPLGLFVGAVVHLERLEGKISKSDRPYLQFLSASSCTLLATASSDFNRGTTRSGSCVGFKSDSGPSDGSPLSFVHLRDLWRSSATSNAVFIVCQINKILRVTLEFSCVSHGSVCVDSSGNCVQCQQLTRFRSVARFSIDDGTGVAYVNCHGDQVANLLTLDAAQWDNLKSKAGDTGGVNYVMQGGGWSVQGVSMSPAESLIHLLCESSIARRPVVLEVKRFRTFHNSAGARFPDINCLGLADFDKKVKRLKDESPLQLETLQLPYLQLEYISMRDINYKEVIASLNLKS